VSQMRDSAKSAEWVARVVAENPIQKVLDDNGQWAGNIRTCPVRLSFFNNSLHTAVAGKNDDGTDKTPTFEVQALFPPCANDQITQVLLPLLYDRVRQDFPQNIGPDGSIFGIKTPLRRQEERQQYGGFTPGGFFLRATTQYKPPVVDSANNPIVDQNRAYPGVWGIISINLFKYAMKVNKGVSFGLQAVMIVADDNKLGGGAVDAKAQFAGVKIDASFDAAKVFGAPTAPPPPVPHSSLL
jgi:hypothetical protein